MFAKHRSAGKNIETTGEPLNGGVLVTGQGNLASPANAPGLRITSAKGRITLKQRAPGFY